MIATITLNIDTDDPQMAQEMVRQFTNLRVLIAQKCPIHGVSVLVATPMGSGDTVDSKCLISALDEMSETIENSTRQGKVRLTPAKGGPASHPRAPSSGALPPLPGSGEAV